MKPTRKNKKAAAKTKTVEHYNAILLEDIQSKMGQVIEGMETTRSELRAEINEFREEVNDRFSLVESAIRKNSEDIRENSEDIRKNSEDIRKNSEDIKKLSDKMDKVISVTDNHEERITVLEEKTQTHV